jgi:hypothetical protein
MIYRILADVIFLLHFCFVFFVIFGGLLLLRWRRLAWLHLPAVTWSILVEFFQLFCPLTRWENRFKTLGGEQGYEGGFVEYYVSKILYADITDGFQLFLGVALLILNLIIYWYVFMRKRQLN